MACTMVVGKIIMTNKTNLECSKRHPWWSLDWQYNRPLNTSPLLILLCSAASNTANHQIQIWNFRFWHRDLKIIVNADSYLVSVVNFFHLIAICDPTLPRKLQVFFLPWKVHSKQAIMALVVGFCTHKTKWGRGGGSWTLLENRCWTSKLVAVAAVWKGLGFRVWWCPAQRWNPNPWLLNLLHSSLSCSSQNFDAFFDTANHDGQERNVKFLRKQWRRHHSKSELRYHFNILQVSEVSTGLNPIYYIYR